MPFGLIFGALFFGVFCGLLGLRWLVQPGMVFKLSGVFLALLGCSLALGLLMRRSWARFTGMAVGLMLSVVGMRQVWISGGALDLVTFFAAGAVVVLLIIPSTGDPARGAPPRAVAASNTIGPVGWTALVSFVGLLAVAMSSDIDATSSAPFEADALPASAVSRSVRWHDFAAGLELARSEGKPVLATFVTDWCPYCTKMTRNTWRASAVVERLGDVVPVRVDVENSEGERGFSGPEIASRYGVAGYPVQMLLEPDGSVIARTSGYQSSRDLLTWIDRELGPAQTASP